MKNNKQMMKKRQGECRTKVLTERMMKKSKAGRQMEREREKERERGGRQMWGWGQGRDQQQEFQS